jgi:hypothetical protein
VRARKYQTAAAQASAMKTDRFAALPASPRSGRYAPSTTRRVCSVSATNSPPLPAHRMSPPAMKFIMMVLMTSWAPVHALSAPGTAPHSAPAAAPAASATGRATSAGVSIGSAPPASAVANAPTASWPSAPMLKSPARKASATDSPVRSSGVALNSTWPIPCWLVHVLLKRSP